MDQVLQSANAWVGVVAVVTLAFTIIGAVVGAIYVLWRALDKKIDRTAERLDARVDRLDAKVDAGFRDINGQLRNINDQLATLTRDVAVIAARREPTKIYHLSASQAAAEAAADDDVEALRE